ncbi:transcriptional regulator [Embleya hyalina]|uniref:Transcriptional regulator n=1 Tax=Embleya hyalina TaxID=516124 RepID=A0A401YSZ5_9ACTN|nr:transcriptional regulator [Embleya hyalina]
MISVDEARDLTNDEAQPGRPAGLIGAVDNVLRLLRLFEDHEMVRVNQVSRDMGLSRSTVHRMLVTLAHHRFVEQEPLSRAYRPGPALIEIGLSVVGRIDVRAVSHDALTRLRDETGETVHLAHLRGPEAVYVDSVESAHAMRTGSRVGWTLPAHTTAAGKALLAELPDAELTTLYPSGELAAPTPRAVTTIGQLRVQLEETRRRGYATNNAESEDDVYAVAAVVRDKQGRARGAISTTAPRSRAGDAWVTATAEAVMRVARELGDRIG